MTRAGQVPAGYVNRLRPLADFRAAEGALRAVVQRGLFTFQAIETYRIAFYLRSPAVLDKVLATRWTESALDAANRHRIQALLRKHPMAQILVREDSRLSVLRRG